MQIYSLNGFKNEQTYQKSYMKNPVRFGAKISPDSIKTIEQHINDGCKLGCLANFLNTIKKIGDPETLLELNFKKAHPNDHIRLNTEKSLIRNPKFNNEVVSFDANFPVINGKVLGLCRATKVNCENLVKDAEKQLLNVLSKKYKLTINELLKKFNINDEYWIKLSQEM